MEFEFDPAKSAGNKIKHGIDFVEAQALWANPLLIEAPATVEDEPRFLAVGRIDCKHWTAIFTLRVGLCRSFRSGARGKRRLAIMKARELDEEFDAGKDVSAAIDWSRARRPNEEPRRVNVDFPAWMVEGLDKQARHLGVTRQSLIKMWIAERLG